MELVSQRWYRGFVTAVTIFCALTLLGSLLTLFWSDFQAFGLEWGFTKVTLVLSAIELVYMLLVHNYLVKRLGWYGASLIVMFLVMIIVVGLIHSTGQLHSWYHFVWITLVFFSGMFGAYTILAFGFLTLLYVVLLITEDVHSITLDLISLIAAVGVFAVAIVAYYFWKKLYKGQESAQVANLQGQIKHSKIQSEILLNSISDGIILISTDGKINLMNPAAATMTGWPVEEAIGIDAATVLKLNLEDGKELPANQNPITKALAAQAAATQTLRLTSRENKALIVSLVVSPVILPSKTEPAGAVAVIRDVSAAREEENRRADFISTASHEMRTPVAAIEGYLALALNDKVSQIDLKARSYLEKAHASTQHLGKLFQDLLTSAKAEDGRLVNNPVIVEMSSFLEQLVDSLRFTAEKKGLLVDFVIGADNNTATAGGVKVIRPLYYVLVDPDRLREVITNLFDNAVKYTESGKISLGLTGNNEVVQLYVRDTGPGIPAEDIPHLFQKFYRVDSSITRTVGGTGLGLFISRKIIEMYHGRVWVESELKKGSTFYINLPRISSQKAAELQKAETVASALGGEPMASTTINTSVTG